MTTIVKYESLVKDSTAGIMHALLVLTAAFAVASDAIMIPSTISLPAVSPSWQALDLGRLLNPGFSSRLVKLDCPDCSVPLSDSHIDHEKSTSLVGVLMSRLRHSR